MNRQISGELLDECAELALLAALVWFGRKKSLDVTEGADVAVRAFDAVDISWWCNRAEVDLQQPR